MPVTLSRWDVLSDLARVDVNVFYIGWDWDVFTGG
jgi:hypothetical protein